MKAGLRSIKQEIFHRFKLYPVYQVIEQINKRFPLKDCHALEAFAYTGAWQTRAYKHFPAYLEAWEIDPACEAALKRNLPAAKIRITNSFEEVKRCTKKFSFINVDTHQGLFGEYCENFEFYPLIFHVAADNCVVNLNVIPHASASWLKKYPDLFSAQHLARRKEFYQVADPSQVTLEQMLRRYGDIARENGYEIQWHYYKKRTLTYYLALHLVKK
jgi:ribosome-associated toxin RatA of RatAB toxin-antitoxin module